MWIWMRKGILMFLCQSGCGSGLKCDADADLDPSFHPDTNPDPDPHLHQIKIQIRNWIDIKKSESTSGSNFSPWNGSGYRSYCSFQIKAQTLKKCSNRLIFHTFRLVICKFIQIGSGFGSSLSLWCLSRCRSGSWFLVDEDLNHDFIWYGCGSRLSKWCGSMRIWIRMWIRIHNMDVSARCRQTVESSVRNILVLILEPVLIMICAWIDWDMAA